MYSFPNLEPVCCSMSSSNCCFPTCIQIFQEAGQLIWYSHLFKNFPVYCHPHVRGFGIVNKTEVNIFLKLSCFFDNPTDVGNLIPGSSAFLNPAWTSGSSQFMYNVCLAWRILSITLLACEWDECNYVVVWAFFGIAFLWDWTENWPFPALWPLLSLPDLQACWV